MQLWQTRAAQPLVHSFLAALSYCNRPGGGPRGRDRIAALRSLYPKVYASGAVLDGYRHPPDSPSECIFAQTTSCVSVDLSTPVVPCQIGGRPECSECGCIAGAGLASIGKFKLAGLLKVSDVFRVSKKLGERFMGRLPQP